MRPQRSLNLVMLLLSVGAAACNNNLVVSSGRLNTGTNENAPKPNPGLPSKQPKSLAALKGSERELFFATGELSFVLDADSGLILYKYAISKDGSCNDTAYSDWISIATALKASLAESGHYTLCLLGKDAEGNEQTTPSTYQIKIYAMQDLAPITRPLSETSIVLQWAAPAGAVVRYELYLSRDKNVAPDFTKEPLVKDIAATTTSLTVSDLAPGTMGRATVRAIMEPSAHTLALAAVSEPYWTPFGTINTPDINTPPVLMGHAGGGYAEAAVISQKFTFFFHGYYWPEFTEVYAGGIPSLANKPVFNLTTHFSNLSMLAGNYDVNQVWSDGMTKFLLPLGNRVFVYSHLPLTSATAAPDLVLGQTAMAANTAGSGASGLNGVHGVCWNGSHLFVSDSGNHRVLIWNGWPQNNGQAADFVLGQNNMSDNGANAGGSASDKTLRKPVSIACNTDWLAVADSENNRVMMWRLPLAATPMPAADVILGQATTTAAGANGAGGASVGGLQGPQAVAMMDNGLGGTAVLVVDTNNHRVVQWDTLPASHGAAFDRVYGQSTKAGVSSNAGGSMSQASLAAPAGITVDHEGKFWVSDFNNGRWLRFDLNMSMPVTHGPNAIGLHGIQSYDKQSYLYGSFSPTRYGTHWWGVGSLDPLSGLFSPSGGRFYNEAPKNGAEPVTVAYGQADAIASYVSLPTTATSIGTNAWSMGFTSAIKIGSRVFWSDEFNKRVLSKAGLFQNTAETPDVILGNLDFTGGMANAGNNNWSYKLQDPTVLATDGTRLLVSDGTRIAVWNAPPTTSGGSNAAMSLAIGETDTLTQTATPVASQTSLAKDADYKRRGMIVYQGKLIVADAGFNRVMIWNTIPATSGAPADVVLGQPNFTSTATGTGLGEMNTPSGVAVINGKLLVADFNNARILVWDEIPTMSHTPANRAWVPKDHPFSRPTNLADGFKKPVTVFSYDGRVYVGLYRHYWILPDIF